MIFRALILRPLLREKIRTTLTILGIAVGVAVVVAIQLANSSALRAFRESVDAVAGRANYQIVSEAAPLKEDVLLKLRPLWDEGVRFAPVIDVEGMVEPSQLPIRLLAVDLLSDLHFREYRYATLSGAPPPSAASGATTESTAGGGGAPPSVSQFLALFDDDAVVVPAPFAREHNLQLGSPLKLNILGHRKTMRVRGILEARGPATAFNGAIAICDIATAQKAFGRLGRLTRIDLMVPEASEERIIATVQKTLPAGARIERPSRRNERVEKMLRAFRINLFALAGVALLVGMFLVYNTVLISILRRRKDVGSLKTLGTSGRQIFAAFASEGLVFGLVGSIAGIALGHVLAQTILSMVGRTINALYITTRPQSVALTPGVIAAGLAVGTLLSLISALQPSLEAARVPPGMLIRPGLQQRITRRRPLVIAAIVLFILSVAASRIPPWRGIALGGYLAVLLVVAGFSLLAPSIVQTTSRLAAPLLDRLFGIVGQLAAASLPASLRRTSVASAALSLATGMMIAVALMVGSFRETVRIWVDQTVRSDLWLRPAKGLATAPNALFPPIAGDEIARVPFVEDIDRVSGRVGVYRDSIVSIVSGEFAVAAVRGKSPMIAPRNPGDAIRHALRTNGVIVSEVFAEKFGYRLGQSIELPTARGMRRFPITGIYRDYSSDRGTIIMDRALYIDSFHDDAISTIVVYLRPGVDHEFARRELERTFGPKYGAFAILNATIRTEVMRIFDQTFLITYALLGVAIVVAVLGIVNTLSALILERTRELALLRVGGMSRGELRTMIVLESSLLGLASTVVGLVMGYALSWILIYVINKQSFGWTIEFHTPARLIAASLAVTFLASALAGLVPARLATRIDVATAIKSE
jgi:putative ABC transport system permease protein